MPLVFVPQCRDFFAWGDDAAALGSGSKTEVALIVPDGRRNVRGNELPLIETLARLAAIPAAALADTQPSLGSWALASKLALDLVVRERVAPALIATESGFEARWAVALSSSDDADSVAAIARCMPRSAHAVPIASEGTRVWTPDALVREFLDAAADALVRSAADATSAQPSGSTRWERRWLEALGSDNARFDTGGFAERTVVDDLTQWSAVALGTRDKPRACFRLELPSDEHAPFVVRYLLQSPDDPSLLVSAGDVWASKSAKLKKLGRAFGMAEETLLEALGRAARLFPAIEQSLAEPKPEGLALDAHGSWDFLNRGAPALGEAGFGVILPSELTASGQRRLRLRLRIGGQGTKVAGVVEGTSGLGLDQIVQFSWEAAIGDQTLTARELEALAKQKAPLVRHRGAWVAVDPRELEQIRKRVREGRGGLTLSLALEAALSGEVKDNGLSASVSADGAFASVIERLKRGAREPVAVPAGLMATLRPYQTRGLAWLSTLGALGLGACLADDMGLGKTVQLIAFLLARRQLAPAEPRSALVIAPTSVVGNWERELERFAPELSVVRHYGGDRARKSDELPRANDTLLLTTYGLLRRDSELLASVDWSTVVLDEAQNIKNAFSATARAARALRGGHRIALTGTPVENRLAELWSILEFANPGLLGPLERFKREVATPIERYGNDEAAERLRRVTSPFVLRRLKSDPSVISDLPPKNEMTVVCTLTREQATLYRAAVDEEMKRIQSAKAGIERRGRVLALLGYLKQICNHPAQYLGEAGPLARRSGKLTRLGEMLEEALAAGDKALVFTQYREMGDRLVSYLGSMLGTEILFLHGGTSRRAREAMVRRFQEEERGARVLVLSLKAGGTGLNLTAANHVFHFDRWWNPAVEDQATDRAYRIGQKRRVQVHKLLCAGTVEEKVARMLEQKKKLASKIVRTGESFITELDDTELSELFSLSSDAAIASEPSDEDAPPESTRRKRRRRTSDGRRGNE